MISEILANWKLMVDICWILQTMAGLGNDVFGGDKGGAGGGGGGGGGIPSPTPAVNGPKAPIQGGIAGEMNCFF